MEIDKSAAEGGNKELAVQPVSHETDNLPSETCLITSQVSEETKPLQNQVNQPTQATQATQSTQSRISPWVHFIWAVTLVAVFSISVIWVLPFFMAQKLANDGLDAIEKALKPDIRVNTVVMHLLGQIDRTRKLVVYSQEFDVEFSREKHKRLFNDWVPAGSAMVRLRVPGNRVQFYVPLDELDISRFHFDEATGRLTVQSPPVKMDQEMVSVQSDPQKITVEEKGSWVPLFGPRVSDLKNEAMAEVKGEVIRAANNELVWNEARREAVRALEDFFSMLKASLREDIRLQIYTP